MRACVAFAVRTWSSVPFALGDHDEVKEPHERSPTHARTRTHTRSRTLIRTHGHARSLAKPSMQDRPHTRTFATSTLAHTRRRLRSFNL